MRHLVRGKRLGRDVPHRKATLQALSVALIKEHRIKTTLSKAKELRRFVEPIITRAKEDNSHNRRQVFSKLQDKEAVSHLFEEVAKKAMDRPGGYTRVIKAGFRKGDGAELAVMELVDYNDIKPEQSSSKSRTRRAGRSNKPTATSTSDDKKDQQETEGKKEGNQSESSREESTKAQEDSDQKKIAETEMTKESKSSDEEE